MALLILADNKDMHKTFEEYNIGPDHLLTTQLIANEHIEKIDVSNILAIYLSRILTMRAYILNKIN